jgi:uncharacterized membrane-anchored protein YhcB (DUF1043 family)
MTYWAWLLVGFGAGALVGAGAVWWLARQRPNELRLRRMQSVLDRFQGEVAHHFQESGQLITRLRSDVELLYSHLEKGAANLTTEEAVQRKLRELEQDDDTGRTTGLR